LQENLNYQLQSIISTKTTASTSEASETTPASISSGTSETSVRVTSKISST